MPDAEIYGVFELVEIQSWTNGVRNSERANAGLFTFTRDGRAAVVSGSNDWVMAYTGTFEIRDATLFIHAKACVVREIENTTITRQILQLDESTLKLASKVGDGSKYTELTWKKVVSL